MTSAKRAHFSTPQPRPKLLTEHWENRYPVANRARIEAIHQASEMTNRPLPTTSGVSTSDPGLGAVRPVGGEGVGNAVNPSRRPSVDTGKGNGTRAA